MEENEQVKVDVIVIGGGPAGLSAAYTMAKGGLEVVVIERGEYSGSKNVSGLLYGTVMDELIPEFYEKAPIERPVSKRYIAFLGDGTHAHISFGSDEWTNPPYNNTFIVYRAQFDRWFASEAEEEEVSLLEGMVADGLLYEGEGENKKVVGVQIRDDEPIYADVVILAEGANAIVTEKAVRELGMRQGKKEQVYALGVKEIISLPKEKIEDRFNLEENEGAAIDLIGSPFENLVGAGFIYTGKETISVGFAAKIETLGLSATWVECEAKRSVSKPSIETIAQTRLTPNDIIDGFKQHPVVRKYLRGGEIVEYSAHLIPEGGYLAVGELTANGLMIVGDAAGLVNMSLYHEGSNLAMASGKFAGETAILAKERGDFSKTTLSEYENKLRQGFVMKDLEKYKSVPGILDNLPELFSLYPKRACKLLIDYFAVSQEPKAEIQRRAKKDFFKGLSKFKLAKDLLKAKKLM